MRRRWLVTLALAAGCGSAGGGGSAIDAGPDGALDSPSEGHAEVAVEAHPDVRPDLAAERGPDAADASDARDARDAADADAPVDRTPDAIVALCPPQIPGITIASGTVSGVLQGASNNPAVSCRGGIPTLGPEAFFTLTLTDAVTVDLVVSSAVDTLIAVRPGACSDAISERACGEDPLPADAGVTPPPPGDGASQHLTGLRVPLAPGMYTIIVDTYSIGAQTSVPFTLTVGHETPRPNASCSTPTFLANGATVSNEPLDLAGLPRAVCGAATQSSLYYTVGVQPGQRLTARATPDGSGAVWMPRIQAFTSCASNTCIAQGHLVSGTAQELDWTNNGQNWQLVYLSVGSDTPVSGATFDLTVNTVDLLATCDHPTQVKDGTVLLSQDITFASTATSTCTGITDRALYYQATLLPMQQINVQVTPSGASGPVVFPTVGIRPTCDGTCTSVGSGANFLNDATAETTVLIEVTPGRMGGAGVFDLAVSIPPPPAGFLVTPESGLVTTESGGTATFTVVLQSPPTADVTIALTSDTPTEGTASPASLRFTADNWMTPQTVTVTGVDDQVADGARAYTIVTAPAVSTDTRYNGLDPDDVSVTNLDNDPGVNFVGADDIVTSESGATTTFQVSLNAAPTATVTMALSTSDAGEGTVSPAQVTFTTTNWNMPQTVTVTGVDDAMVDGTQIYTIVTGALASSDGRYAGQNPPDLTARNRDDDQVAVGIKVISGDHSCNSPSNMTYPITVDRAGTMYIAMQCESGLLLSVSTDGGVTFSDPAPIPGTGLVSGTWSLVGGAPGFLYLLMGGSDGNVYFFRTTDGGTTWSSAALISNHGDVQILAAGEKTVLVLVPGPDGSNATMLLRSTDGGRTFGKSLMLGQGFDVNVQPDARTAWLLQLDTDDELSKSTDSGATFTPVHGLSEDLQFHVVGTNKIFALPGNLRIISLADPTQVQQSVDFLSNPPFAMAVDDVDSVMVLDSDGQGHLRATRVVPSATPPTGGRNLGPAPNNAGIVALSRKAAGVVSMNGNILLYTTIVW
jgi:hypothetical protein